MLAAGNPYLDPLIAFAGLAVIILICRWVFSTDHRVPQPPPAQHKPDYGLLEPVTVVRTRADAEALCDVLRAGGIRATVTPTDGAYAVLVFRTDLATARDLVRSS